MTEPAERVLDHLAVGLSVGLGVAAMVVAVSLAVRTRAWDPTVPVLLDVLLAAAMLHLTGTDDSWRSIAAVAALVVLRALWAVGAGPSRTGGKRPRRHAG